ncbi:MAG: hypothetical protein NVS3B25_09860 [Hymenobacter sp.]
MSKTLDALGRWMGTGEDASVGDVLSGVGQDVKGLFKGGNAADDARLARAAEQHQAIAAPPQADPGARQLSALMSTPMPIAGPEMRGNDPLPAPRPDPVVAPPAPAPVAKGGSGGPGFKAGPNDNSFIKAALDRGALGPAPWQPEATGTVTPAPPPVDDLKAAQDAANHHRDLMGGLDLVTSGLDQVANVKHDDWYRRQEEGADQGVKDLIQRREQGRLVEADKARHDAADPTSNASKMTQEVALALGWSPESARNLTANQFDLVKEAGRNKEAQDKLASELTKTKLETASHEKVGAENNKTQLTVGRERNAMELEKERMAADAKGAKGAAGANVGDQEIVKLKNFENAIRELQKYKTHYTNASGLGPSGGRLMDERHQLAPLLSEADNPNSKGNVSAVDRAESELPDRFTRDARGLPAINNKLAQLKNNYKTLISGLKGEGKNVTGFDPNQFDEPAAGAVGPHGPTVTQHGHTFTWNPATGSYE